jgi:predicted short-subunit dehydrogenase-like oxidoreductase (DUF2520 family)
VKAWRDGNGTDAARGRKPGAASGAGEERDRSAAIGRHRHGDTIHVHLEPHPHVRGRAGAPSVGIVGAGSVGTALGLAIAGAGWPVVAVASRDAGRRERFGQLVPSARAFADAQSVVDEAELIVVSVPDDAVAAVAESIRLYGGQDLVHTSGVLGADVLQPALAAGSQIGGFHPLVSFTADVERSAAALRGATIALEGDDRLMALLADLAEVLGAIPVRLPPGAKAAYHAAATLASGGLVALLDAVAGLGAAAGLDEPGALAVYGRLVEQTLANARGCGINAALTGPVTRGDAGTIAAHLAALRRLAPDVEELYVAVVRREIGLAAQRGTLSPAALEAVRAALAKTV